MTAASDVIAKMQTLSDERAARVVSLIEDLADLEARENAEDIAAAREALADGEAPVPGGSGSEAECRTRSVLSGPGGN
jgi:hypothetical protein